MEMKQINTRVRFRDLEYFSALKIYKIKDFMRRQSKINHQLIFVSHEHLSTLPSNKTKNIKISTQKKSGEN